MALKMVAAPILVSSIVSRSCAGAKETRETPNALLKFLEQKGLLKHDKIKYKIHGLHLYGV